MPENGGMGYNRSGSGGGGGGDKGFFVDIESFLFFNGAMQSFLNVGSGLPITTIVFQKIAQNPEVSAKVIGRPIKDHVTFSTDKDLYIRFFFAHSTINQTLDLDFDYIVINDGDNVNTKVAGATQTENPVTPAIAYDEFYVDYAIPHAEMIGYFYVSFHLTRITGGGDTGDLHLVKTAAYQI